MFLLIKAYLRLIINLENVGVCVHTYFYHIIEHYDNLDDIIVFLPGSCMDENKKPLKYDFLTDNMKHGGSVKKMASGGSASSRADGIAQRGKTRGKMC